MLKIVVTDNYISNNYFLKCPAIGIHVRLLEHLSATFSATKSSVIIKKKMFDFAKRNIYIDVSLLDACDIAYN